MTGTVLVVTSGKGGVGKTTTALNLGVALRGNGHSVALVDGDLGMANLAPMLGIEASTTLHDVLAGEATTEEATLEEADGFGVVPGAPDLEAFASIDPGELPGVLSTLAGEYEYVVVDAGPGVHYESTLPIEAADEVVLVTTPAGTSVEDTRKVAALAGMMDGTVRGAVINRAIDGTDPEGIAAELGVDLLAVVPEDSAVRESTDAGVPIERHAPESPAAASYRRLADVLTGVEGSPDSTAGEAAPGDSPPEGDTGSPDEGSPEEGSPEEGSPEVENDTSGAGSGGSIEGALAATEPSPGEAGAASENEDSSTAGDAARPEDDGGDDAEEPGDGGGDPEEVEGGGDDGGDAEEIEEEAEGGRDEAEEEADESGGSGLFGRLRGLF